MYKDQGRELIGVGVHEIEWCVMMVRGVTARIGAPTSAHMCAWDRGQYTRTANIIMLLNLKAECIL